MGVTDPEVMNIFIHISKQEGLAVWSEGRGTGVGVVVNLLIMVNNDYLNFTTKDIRQCFENIAAAPNKKMKSIYVIPPRPHPPLITYN